MRVVVERLDADATQCGISESQIESIANLTLRNNRVQPNPTAVGYLYVAITVIPSSGYCIHTTAVQVLAPGMQIGNSGFRGRAANVELCDKHSVGALARVNFPMLVENDVERLIKQCLGSLDY